MLEYGFSNNRRLSSMLWQLFVTFFKIGLFTIGGGYAMIPLIESEIVDRKQWIPRSEFPDILALSQSAPGVFAVNISICIGYKLRDGLGSIISALGTTLPSILIILLIALFFNRFQEIEIVNSIFKGIRPAVIALILTPTIGLYRQLNINRYTILIPIITALLIVVLGVSPIWVILSAMVLSVAYYIVKKQTIRDR